MRAYEKTTIEGSNENTKELFKSAFIIRNILKENLSEDEFSETINNLYKALRKALNLPNNHICVAKGNFKNEPDAIVYVIKLFESIADGYVYDIHEDEETGKWYIEIPDDVVGDGTLWDLNVKNEQVEVREKI